MLLVLYARLALMRALLARLDLEFMWCDAMQGDVFVATSEPHGDIEATVVREGATPHVLIS